MTGMNKVRLETAADREITLTHSSFDIVISKFRGLDNHKFTELRTEISAITSY
jgi:hypothetical protein